MSALAIFNCFSNIKILPTHSNLLYLDAAIYCPYQCNNRDEKQIV